MGAISRINKSPLSQRTKTQLRAALKDSSRFSVLSADTTGTENTTLGNVSSTELRLPVEKGRKYLVTAQIYVVHTTNNGSKVGITGPASPTVLAGRTDTNGTVAVYDAYTDVCDVAAAGALYNLAKFEFYLVPVVDGTLIVQSAESTNHADSITVKAGSWLRLEEVYS